MADLLEPRIQRISELEEKCRKALGYKSVFEQISSNKGAYEEICALLDFIGDSQSALLSIVPTEQRRTLEPYFLAYGILQLMYSRQVAVMHVMKTLSLHVPELLKKGTLVDARKHVIGHPISSDGAAHVIVRYTLNQSGFEYRSFYTGEIKKRNVKYEHIVKEHIDAMEAGMESLYKHIAGFENVRRQTMRTDPLSQKLSRIDYVVRQVKAALFEERYGPTCESNLDNLLSALGEFRAGLLKRCGEERTAYEVDHVVEGIRMLRSLYPPQDEEGVRRYRIIADGVDSNVTHLVTMARDIDEEEGDDLS